MPRSGIAGSYGNHSFLKDFFFFMAVQNICCCMSFLLVAASGGYSLVVVCGLLIMVASLVAEHRVWSLGSTVEAQGLRCSSAGGIFPDQGLNPCLLHWQADSLPLKHQESPLTPFLLSVSISLLNLPAYFHLPAEYFVTKIHFQPVPKAKMYHRLPPFPRFPPLPLCSPSFH